METWDDTDKSDVEVRLVYFVNDRKQAFAFTEFRDAVINGQNHEICYYYECGPITDISLLPNNLHGFHVWIDPANPPEGFHEECKHRWNDEGVVSPCKERVLLEDRVISEPGVMKTIEPCKEKPVIELDGPQPSQKQQLGFTI